MSDFAGIPWWRQDSSVKHIAAIIVKGIAAAIRTALKTIPTLAGFVVDVVEFQQCQFLRDPDGKTRHAAIQFRYLISHTA